MSGTSQWVILGFLSWWRLESSRGEIQRDSRYMMTCLTEPMPNFNLQLHSKHPQRLHVQLINDWINRKIMKFPSHLSLNPLPENHSPWMLPLVSLIPWQAPISALAYKLWLQSPWQCNFPWQAPEISSDDQPAPEEDGASFPRKNPWGVILQTKGCSLQEVNKTGSKRIYQEKRHA